jgi:hypothetical protein
VMYGAVEIVMHHASIYVNWSCRKCLSPEHPTRFCTEVEDAVEKTRKKATCAVDQERLVKQSRRGTSRGRKPQVKMLAKLEALLRSEGKDAEQDTRRSTAQTAMEQHADPMLQSDTEASSTGSVLYRQQMAGAGDTSGDHSEVGSVKEKAEGAQAEAVTASSMRMESKETEVLRTSPGATQLMERDGTEDDSAEDVSAEAHEFGYDGEDPVMMDTVDAKPLPTLYAEAVKGVKQSKRAEATKMNDSPRGRSPHRRSNGAGN